MMTYLDHQRIVRFLINTSMPGRFEFLAKLINKFSIIEPETVPQDLVTMNSEVIIHDFTEQKDFKIKLVYHYTEDQGTQVTIMAPLGMALIGMRQGQIKTYGHRDSEERKILLKEIIYQPEAEGRLDL